jgi:hypothetical protein
MTAILAAVVLVLALALGALAAVYARGRTRPGARAPASGTGRILFPFVGDALSPRALDAALRLARAESAALVPVFLARVPLHLPLDAPLPRQSSVVIRLQEAIEQRAAVFGVPVDARVERGRTDRHALRQTISHESFDRIVVAAASHSSPGFRPEDVAWLLENAPGEIVVLRPANGEQLEPSQARTARRGRDAGRGRVLSRAA